MAVDSAGNVYVADLGAFPFFSTGNHTIRKITPAGVVSTLAGLAGSFGSADGTGSAALFDQPAGVAVDSHGNVYVADLNNNTIRVGVKAPPVITTVGQRFAYQLETSGATSLSVTNLPPGLSFNAQLAAIIGIPTVAGTFQVDVSATYSNVATQTPLTIVVQPTPPSGLVITSGTSATGRAGRLFQFQVTTSSTNPSATLNASSLPPGLSLNSVTGLISGTPRLPRQLVGNIDDNRRKLLGYCHIAT